MREEIHQSCCAALVLLLRLMGLYVYFLIKISYYGILSAFLAFKSYNLHFVLQYSQICVLFSFFFPQMVNAHY